MKHLLYLLLGISLLTEPAIYGSPNKNKNKNKKIKKKRKSSITRKGGGEKEIK